MNTRLCGNRARGYSIALGPCLGDTFNAMVIKVALPSSCSRVCSSYPQLPLNDIEAIRIREVTAVLITYVTWNCGSLYRPPGGQAVCRKLVLTPTEAFPRSNLRGMGQQP